jgi:hypothetical protein
MVLRNVTIFSKEEIQQKIEALSGPGETVFFYLGASPAHGGPLDRGAAVVELNPNYPEKKGKKFHIYVADVAETQPVGKGQKVFDSDKPKEVASWIKERHLQPYTSYTEGY